MKQKLLLAAVVASMAFGPIAAGFAGIFLHDQIGRDHVGSGRFVNDTTVQYCVLDSTGFEWYCSSSPIKGIEAK